MKKYKIKKFLRNILAITSLFILLALSGCSSETDGKQSGIFPSIGEGKSTSTSSTQGISLEFAEGNPPEEMIKGVAQNFAFVIRNYQTHEVTDMSIKSKGYDTSYAPALSQFEGNGYSVSSVPKATTQAGPGVFDGLVVSGVSVDGFDGDYNFNPSFDYCYTAKTNYREQICVPSTRNQCDVKIEKLVNHNGPLTVSLDRITPIENEIRLDFTITNSGNGDVVNECFDTEDYSNEYKNLDVRLGSAQGSCTAVSGQKIIGNKASFYCTFSRSSDESYSSQVVVEFEYLYQQTTQKKIVVKDLNAE